MSDNNLFINIKHFQDIANIFEYPLNDFNKGVNDVQTLLNDKYPDAGAELVSFTHYANNTALDQKQEIYTRTFDVQAITTMDCGYLIFGDDYKRGELLSNLNREHINSNNELYNQMADHIPNLLRLLPKLNDKELAEDLVSQIIKPALRKITGEFDPERIKRKNELYKKHHQTLIESSEDYSGVYVYAFKALRIVLGYHFTDKEAELPESSSDFLKSISSEIELEHSK